MQTMDQLFQEINSYPLTTKAKINTRGKNLTVHNELPLISQSLANSVATVAWGLSSPRGQKNIQKTIENSVKRKFLPFVNGMARGNRKSLHHVYEWGKTGMTSARLFDLKIPEGSRAKANFSMRLEFYPSKTLVPLTEAQETPNEKTGAVVKKVHIFYNKAMIMEYGDKVTVRPKNTKYMAFDNPPGARQTDSGLTFSSKPMVIDYSKMQTSHALTAVLSNFFNGMGGQAAATGVRNYTKTVGRGAGRAAHMITVSTPSDAYAKAVAARVTSAMVASHG